MATITLTENCPACIVIGKSNRLLQNIGEDELHCTKGHKFADYAAVEGYKSEPMPSKSVAKRIAHQKSAEAPAKAITGPPADLSSPEEDALAAFDVPETPNLEAGRIAHDPDRDKRVAETVREFEPPYEPKGIKRKHEYEVEVLQTATVRHVPNSAVMVAGGALELKILVPEQYVVPLQSVAKENGKSVEEYMAEAISFAMENRWFI